MSVIDASVVVDGLVADSTRGAAARQVLAEADSLHAPHLIDVEVAHVLRRLTRLRRVERGLASTALGQLAELPILRYPHVPLLDRIWELRDTLSAYDAAYVAVAEAVGEPLVTTDAALAIASGVAVDVTLLS